MNDKANNLIEYFLSKFGTSYNNWCDVANAKIFTLDVSELFVETYLCEIYLYKNQAISFEKDPNPMLIFSIKQVKSKPDAPSDEEVEIEYVMNAYMFDEKEIDQFIVKFKLFAQEKATSYFKKTSNIIKYIKQ